MTAQQVRELGRADELPLAAFSPDVDVQATLAGESDQCCRHPLPPGEDMAPQGRWEVRYQFDTAYPVRTERVCPECAQDELQELLDWGVVALSLHLPGDWAQTPPIAGDIAFADLETCVEYLRNMRNTCRTGESWDGFEACRKLAIAAVSQIGVKRIGDLERRAA